MKKIYTPAFKAQVVQELLKETKTITQLAAEHSVHPNLLRDGKLTVLKGMAGLFEKGDSIEALRTSYDQQREERFAQIGRLTTQVTWLKKTNPVACDIPPGEKRCRLPLGARSSIMDCCIPKTRPRNLLVCGRPTSDQSP